MKKDLFMIVELKDGTLINVYELEEKFQAKDYTYESLTEFFINYLIYVSPCSVESCVKDFLVCNESDGEKVKMSQKRALYNFNTCCTTVGFNYSDFINWTKECELRENKKGGSHES